MRKDGYFIMSVIIALVVPVLIGAIYFKSLYDKYVVLSPITKMDAPIELIQYGENIINVELSSENNFSYDFDINYNGGIYDSQTYSIFLNIITISRDNINWLLKKDGSLVSSGSLGDIIDNRILLLGNEKIERNEKNSYELQFYLEESTSSDNIKLKGRLSL